MPRKKASQPKRKRAPTKRADHKPCKACARRAKKVTVAKGVKLARGKESKLQKKPGNSNVGKYKNVPAEDFCGAAGGASRFAYPVNTKKRARAALAYAHNAPKPSGIRKCVKKKYPKMGVKKTSSKRSRSSSSSKRR